MSIHTKVIFRVLQGDVIALFPSLPGDHSPRTCLSYQHVGQHGAAQACALGRPAEFSEYEALLRELQAIGYRVRIVKRFNRADYRQRDRVINGIALRESCPYCHAEVSLIGTVIPSHVNRNGNKCPAGQKQYADAVKSAAAIFADIFTKEGIQS